MPDKTKVIYDIERCICHVPDACRDCSHYQDDPELDCTENLLADALAMLKEQPQIVRCSDCVHRNYCSIHDAKYLDDWFCADGERR